MVAKLIFLTTQIRELTADEIMSGLLKSPKKGRGLSCLIDLPPKTSMLSPVEKAAAPATPCGNGGKVVTVWEVREMCSTLSLKTPLGPFPPITKKPESSEAPLACR